jgi:Homing endonuclease associated repeat
LPGHELIELTRARALETGAPPRVTDWTGDNEKWDREYPRWPSRLAVTERFGGWPAALEAAGFAPYVRRWSDQEIVAALRALAGELGRAPTPQSSTPAPTCSPATCSARASAPTNARCSRPGWCRPAAPGPGTP